MRGWLSAACACALLLAGCGEQMINDKAVGEWKKEVREGSAAQRKEALRILREASEKSERVVPDYVEALVSVVESSDATARLTAYMNLQLLGPLAEAAVPALKKAMTSEKADKNEANVKECGKALAAIQAK